MNKKWKNYIIGSSSVLDIFPNTNYQALSYNDSDRNNIYRDWAVIGGDVFSAIIKLSPDIDLAKLLKSLSARITGVTKTPFGYNVIEIYSDSHQRSYKMVYRGDLKDLNLTILHNSPTALKLHKVGINVAKSDKHWLTFPKAKKLKDKRHNNE